MYKIKDIVDKILYYDEKYKTITKDEDGLQRLSNYLLLISTSYIMIKDKPLTDTPFYVSEDGVDIPDMINYFYKAVNEENRTNPVMDEDDEYIIKREMFLLHYQDNDTLKKSAFNDCIREEAEFNKEETLNFEKYYAQHKRVYKSIINMIYDEEYWNEEEIEKE
jgi:hypothetical protein